MTPRRAPLGFASVPIKTCANQDGVSGNSKIDIPLLNRVTSPGSVRLADREEADVCVEFFARHLTEDNVFSREFLCPMGVRAAVTRGQVIVCKVGLEVIAAVRFYCRKRTACVSIYQFAVNPTWRGHRLSLEMIKAVPRGLRISCCSPSSSLNEYYVKTGWTLRRRSCQKNEWTLPCSSAEQSPPL
ncbi:hypothetical protein CfE428DRAFT_1322 [Chthoniobacter flavus Ellin428]|uniref:N-acetyltransferase domain-containing protein n=1 Tax=Chthoniobacter flavus Ellin428 TaxID=497964 RepID=B4CXN1_9BACT|nr:hypothetical protein CfE428DRAFT_1322 [Chthoniobacter flavus Ellin428]TCO88754.1 hypothetical protein EV701_116126 [Chthoniobacter flavus]